MPRTYRPELLAAVAQRAAQKVGRKVIRWVRVIGEAPLLHVEAEVRLLSGRTVTVRLQGGLPE
jgi:hypothetical protein